MTFDLDPEVNFFTIKNRKTCSKEKLFRIISKTKIQ